VIHALGLVLTRTTWRTFVIAFPTTRRAAAAITFWTTITFRTVRALTTLTGWAGFTRLAGGWLARLTRGLLPGLFVIRALVRVNGGGVVILRVGVLFGRHMGRFLLLASANDTFQAGFKAAEKGGFLRGVFGSAWGGHKRFLE
jgi:hypothetical protein